MFYAALFRVVLGYYDFNFQVVYLLEIPFRLLERQTDGSTPVFWEDSNDIDIYSYIHECSM